MAYAGDGLPYPPQPGFTAVPQDQGPQNYNPWQNQPQDQGPQNSNPWQTQPQGLPVQPGPPMSLPAPTIPMPAPGPPMSLPALQVPLPAPQISAVPNVPSGLEYLIQVDQVLIQQKRHSMFQYNCEYDVLNAVSQRIYHAQQMRECWGPLLDVRVYGNSQQQILQLLLPSKFCSWETELEVYSTTSGLIGYVVKEWTAFSIKLSILNIAKECVLKVVGPGFGMPAFSDINFEVKTSDESQMVGRITRVWKGLKKEMFSANDHYSVQFPMNLDAKVKALLMATGIFIDYVYFEARNRRHHRNHHMNHMKHHRRHHRHHR